MKKPLDVVEHLSDTPENHKHNWSYVPETHYCEYGCCSEAQYECRSYIKYTVGQNGQKLKKPRYKKCEAYMSMGEVEEILNKT